MTAPITNNEPVTFTEQQVKATALTLPSDVLAWEIIQKYFPVERSAIAPVCKTWTVESDRTELTEEDQKNHDLVHFAQLVGTQIPALAGYLKKLELHEPLSTDRLQMLRDRKKTNSDAKKISYWMHANKKFFGDDLGSCPHDSIYRTMDLSSQNFRYIPEEIGLFTGLRCLYLQNNALKTLPKSIGALSSLWTLDLTGNRFEALPKELESIPFLHDVRLDNNKFPSKRTLLRRIALVCSVICGILSLISPIKSICSLVTRSFAVLAAGDTGVSNLSRKGTLRGAASLIAGIAPPIIGLVGLILGSPLIVAIALMVSSGFQLINLGKAIKEKDPFKALLIFGFMLINALTLTGMLAGYWQFMAAAASLSALMMLIMGCIACAHVKNGGDVIDVLSYFALSGVSIGSAVMVSEFTTPSPAGHFTITNDHKEPLVLKDSHGNTVAVIAPGETAQFEARDDIYYQGDCEDNITAAWLQDDSGNKYFADSAWGYEHVVKDPMSVADFPTLPVGTPSLSPNWEASYKPWMQYVKA